MFVKRVRFAGMKRSRYYQICNFKPYGFLDFWKSNTFSENKTETAVNYEWWFIWFLLDSNFKLMVYNNKFKTKNAYQDLELH